MLKKEYYRRQFKYFYLVTLTLKVTDQEKSTWLRFCKVLLKSTAAGPYRHTKDLVPLFDPKVHLFENSILKIMAQLHFSEIVQHLRMVSQCRW